jgi:hypothetical protein
MIAGQPHTQAQFNDEIGVRRPGFLRQWALLSRRSFELLTRDRLTLAILAGAPALVIAMMAVLFRPGAFSYDRPSLSATLMIVYWVAFGAFFFGLTYGLLQICTEFPIFLRERLVNLRIGPYLLSKVTVLLPVLVLVVGTMLGVLRALDRMPQAGPEVYAALFVTLLFDGCAALALGLLTSAAVATPEQVTLALPMLCFPQVLFSGAILAVPLMAAPGKVISVLMSDAWAFNALGRSLRLNDLFANGNSSLGPGLLAQYGDSFSHSVALDWAIMGAVSVVFLALAGWVLGRKSGTGNRRMSDGSTS